YHNLGIVLKAEKKLVYTEQLIPPIPPYVASAETFPADVLATHTRWVHAQQEITCLMLTSMTLELQKNLDDFNVNDTIKELKTLFLQQAEHEPLETVKALHACKQEEGYIGKIIVELHAMIKIHEKGLPKKAVATPTVLAIRGGKIQKNNTNKQPHAVQGKGHGNDKGKIAYAPKPKIPHNQRRRTLKRTRSAIIMVKWVNGRGTVLPTYLIELMKKKNKTRGASSSALNLYVGNGNRAAVEAIGSFDLILPNGLCIVLDNCHYASVITRGAISVSCLKDNGFIHCFTDYGILVSKDYIVYFSAILRDGIYEIDMHGCVSNDSSMYEISNKRAKHNLDSTFLWHCHLGHRNKKRIEKLQHDRLSKPTDSESFYKCV
ncbi:zinc finger, CCHC-type containing protein, partial [Tanacetum coccineum]